jgi:hypothetical protein
MTPVVMTGDAISVLICQTWEEGEQGTREGRDPERSLSSAVTAMETIGHRDEVLCRHWWGVRHLNSLTAVMERDVCGAQSTPLDIGQQVPDRDGCITDRIRLVMAKRRVAVPCGWGYGRFAHDAEGCVWPKT